MQSMDEIIVVSQQYKNKATDSWFEIEVLHHINLVTAVQLFQWFLCHSGELFFIRSR